MTKKIKNIILVAINMVGIFFILKLFAWDLTAYSYAVYGEVSDSQIFNNFYDGIYTGLIISTGIIALEVVFFKIKNFIANRKEIEA